MQKTPLGRGDKIVPALQLFFKNIHYTVLDGVISKIYS
jgi:hypothetical protein